MRQEEIKKLDKLKCGEREKIFREKDRSSALPPTFNWIIVTNFKNSILWFPGRLHGKPFSLFVHYSNLCRQPYETFRHILRQHSSTLSTFADPLPLNRVVIVSHNNPWTVQTPNRAPLLPARWGPSPQGRFGNIFAPAVQAGESAVSDWSTSVWTSPGSWRCTDQDDHSRSWTGGSWRCWTGLK